MSEVIREFILKHPSLTEKEAFENFLHEPRIFEWIGSNSARRERIRREFQAAWERARGAPATPTRGEAPASTARRLEMLCPECAQLDVWSAGVVLECRSCGRAYDDMLMLIPVKPVGPFAFVFGEGLAGAASATGVGLVLAALYGVFRWLA